MKKKELKKAMKKINKLIAKDMELVNQLENKLQLAESSAATKRAVVDRLRYLLNEKKEKKEKKVSNYGYGDNYGQSQPLMADGCVVAPSNCY